MLQRWPRPLFKHQQNKKRERQAAFHIYDYFLSHLGGGFDRSEGAHTVMLTESFHTLLSVSVRHRAMVSILHSVITRLFIKG